MEKFKKMAAASLLAVGVAAAPVATSIATAPTANAAKIPVGPTKIYLTMVTPANAATAVRVAPATGTKIVETLRRGSSALYLGRSGSFIKVKAFHSTGYVLANSVRVTKVACYKYSSGKIVCS